MSTILVEDRDVVRWLLNAAKNDPRRAFNDFAPHYCKLCDDPVPPCEQRPHLNAHRREMNRLSAQQRREAIKRLKRASRLYRETK